ncbi:MAG: C/D box methylation guide ribonucleoprotein complex aNOP56 subunit [Candidatus Methanomethylicota archaeon]|uniref:C/D box methylation guide ribonucleoprotein complex aNOP56 subunit n=1 Tax=Thermoproteota archaeon TaxID=2056631 RepID=A0A497EY14_9CREN|nr:MAG: C/D box methylation guide ribonucleoprotein complex aNOP56 subunit [Candidatus Verstraetearchaeota archaeon]RLE54330.1 MAG: C/D box methylation guide ribonucleoprotein complex aNOP56 subunit [Candidatus Verstraetearchaeota archaeon]
MSSLGKAEVSKAYLVETAFAIFACNEEGEVFTFEAMPKNAEEVAEKLLKLEEGEAVEELKKLCNKLISMGVKAVVVEDEMLARSVKSLLDIPVLVEAGNSIAKKVRGELEDLVVKLNLFPTHEDASDFLFSVSMLMTRKKLREAAEKRDLLIAHAVNAIDDLNKSINLLVTRLREWYGVHFPELNDLVRDHESFVRLVASLGLRSNFTEENLIKLGFPEPRARRISSAARESVGADIAEMDIEPMMRLSSIINEMYKMRDDLEEYIDQTMDEVAPNIKGLIGALIGARLIALAGGLEELARLPASTIQVLGAEKALFRALRSGAKPPKHGVIFQCPEIHRSPRWQRGKIARALAGKLAIAARVDAFTGTYIADELKEDLKKRIEEIKKIYAKPPKRVIKKRRPPRKRGRRR